jgi:hypothetical protein
MNAYGYGGAGTYRPVLGSAPKDASQVKGQGYLDTKRINNRKENPTNETPLYPLNGNDDVQHAVIHSHPLLYDPEDQDGVSPKFFGTLNGEGVDEMAKTKKPELARASLKRRLALLGVSVQDIDIKQAGSTPFTFIMQGKVPIPIHDPTCNVGDTVAVDFPDPKKLAETFMYANKTGLAKQGTTTVLVKHKPENFANFIMGAMQEALSDNNLTKLPQILDSGVKTPADNAVVNALSLDMQSSLTIALLTMAHVTHRGLFKLNVDDTDPNFPRELADPRTNQMLGINEAVARMFYFMGLSKRVFAPGSEPRITPERRRFYKVLRLELINMFYSDGTKSAYDFGNEWSTDVNGKSIVSSNKARLPAAKIANTLQGDVLNMQINHRARALAAWGNAKHETDRWILGRLVRVDKNNNLGEVILNQAIF